MWDLRIAFDNPWWPWLMALLVGLVIALWGWSFHSLSGLGHWRRVAALLFRTVVLALIVLALADLQILRRNDGLTVIYLLDQSSSIPVAQRQSMLKFVADEVEAHRDDAHRDRASVIIFGRAASIEIPPLDDDLPLMDRIEGAANLRTDATNLEAALKLAQATFPEDASKRVVIISNGNENRGQAEPIARQLAADGVSIDVVPVEIQRRSEIAVERVALPGDIRKGQPFDATVVLHNLTEGGQGQPVAGRVKLVRRQGATSETLDESDVVLEPGKTVLRFNDAIDQPDFYEYEAVFSPADTADDALTQNNRATGFTFVRGKGSILVIEDWENRQPDGSGQFRYLVDRLRQNNFEVQVQFSDQLFSSLAELQRFDCVILANLPRSSGSSADNLSNFSDRQVEMLVRNTQQMGCGLIMLGGENAFGAGGWANTELEKAMPVDFQIRNTKVQAVGALVMIMHASELPEGNHWQKVIGREALKALGPQDYCGVVAWDSGTFRESWLWGKPQGLIRVGNRRSLMLSRMDRMSPGDMPDFDPAMKIAAKGFGAVKAAAVKHMIIISDGDPSPPSSGVISILKKLNVKVTTVAVGTHGPPGSTPLQRIASSTGGKYYVVRNPKALPRIYQREARRVARPLVVEKEIAPQSTGWHEVMQGVDALPTLDGFVMTTLKENPLVETALISPYPVNTENATLLATWQYGLGRSTVFTSDAGHRWADAWTSWDGYDKFFSQMVRWTMRPAGDAGNFTVSTQVREGKVQVIVDAFDKDDAYLNFLDVNATLVGPTLDPQDLRLRQTAPGRYVGEFEAGRSGSYFLSIQPGAGQSLLRTGINVPYSAEFRDRETNEALLTSLASLEPEGGAAGQVIRVPLDQPPADWQSEVNTFRRDIAPTVSSNYVWPWLVLLAGCLFFGDVLVRRVALEFGWLFQAIARLRDWVLRREAPVVSDQQMARLRSRKAAVSQSIDERRASTRFEPEEDGDVQVLREAVDREAHDVQDDRPTRSPGRRPAGRRRFRDALKESQAAGAARQRKTRR